MGGEVEVEEIVGGGEWDGMGMIIGFLRGMAI